MARNLSRAFSIRFFSKSLKGMSRYVFDDDSGPNLQPRGRSIEISPCTFEPSINSDDIHNLWARVEGKLAPAKNSDSENLQEGIHKPLYPSPK